MTYSMFCSAYIKIYLLPIVNGFFASEFFLKPGTELDLEFNMPGDERHVHVHGVIVREVRVDESKRFRVRILSPLEQPFTCGNGIPVSPQVSIADDPSAEIVILPEIWLGPDESVHGRYPALIEWLRRQYALGAELYSACSGSILLAETGLLDGRAATSHWGYTDLFRQHYPKVRFDPASNLVYADETGRIVTACRTFGTCAMTEIRSVGGIATDSPSTRYSLLRLSLPEMKGVP